MTVQAQLSPGQKVQDFLDDFSSRPHHAWILKGPHDGVKKPFVQSVTNHLIPDLGLEANEDWEDKMHPNFLYISLQGSDKTTISIEQIRSISKFVAHTSADGGWKIVVIDALNDLNRNGENGLLKTLESPPPRTLFFLMHRMGKPILPTILSRCAQIPFGDHTQGNQAPGSSSSEEALFFLGPAADHDTQVQYLELYALIKNHLINLIATNEKTPIHQILDLLKRDEHLIVLFLNLVDKWVKWSTKHKALDEEEHATPFSDLSLETLLSLDTYVSKLKRDYRSLGFDPKQAVFGICLKISQKN